jgi:hypothetical protein
MCDAVAAAVERALVRHPAAAAAGVGLVGEGMGACVSMQALSASGRFAAAAGINCFVCPQASSCAPHTLTWLRHPVSQLLCVPAGVLLRTA